ncbi:MAG: 3-hydroxyacyl-CoA dehydrogenase NAD-binding domain-containing protein [Nevskiaceae bacterium]
MSTHWTLQRDADGVATLTLDRPGASANSLSRAVMEELAVHLQALDAAPPRGLILRSGKRGSFVAGADIKEFTALTDFDSARLLIRGGQQVLDALEALPCPTVALIEGFALGGGLELALACRYRIGLDDGRLSLGLPEVLLGIHPGFGGTVRAVRLIGAPAALDMMLTGRTIRAAQGLRLGLIDALCTDREQLERRARDLIDQKPSRRRASLALRALSLAPLRPIIRRRVLRDLARKARREHYPAPYAIVDLWSRYGARGRASYEAEADSIARLFLTDTSRNLVRVFMLQDQLKASGDKTLPTATRVHVVGAGVMGADIAAWCALRGLDVTLQDRDAGLVEAAIQRVRPLFERRIKDNAKREAAITRLRPDAEGRGIATADVLIEAIVENVEAKQALYRQLDTQLPADAVIATNTSSIQLEALRGALRDPHRLVGLHFFNPVAQMPLVEVIHTRDTPAAILARAVAFTRQLDKLPLPCRSAPGFLVNRVLAPYMLEAVHAASEGVPLDTIDQSAVDFGMPVGPVELSDMVGLDVCRNVGAIVASATGRALPDLALIEARIGDGKLGRKSGEGFYRWQDGKVQRPAAALVSHAATPQVLADLQDRLLLSIANEAVACLREGVVSDAQLVDAGIIFGSGYAPFRGGPLQDARRRGIAQCVARLQELAERYGPRFTPDAGWDLLR